MAMLNRYYICLRLSVRSRMVSLDEFSRFVERIIKLFDDRLILGVSNELPPGGDVSMVRLVAEIIDRMKVLS